MASDSQGTSDQEAASSNATRSLSRRTFLRSATYAASGALLAACGGAPSPSGSGGSSAPGQESDVITITQWYHQYGEEGTLQAAQRYAEEYSKVNPKVRVKVVWVPGDYRAKLNTALLTPEGPDVFEGNYPTLDMVRAGQLEPLDDLLSEEFKQDFSPQDLQAATIDGRIYAIKMIIDTGLLYYRKSMLEAAGVTPPTTFDELMEAAKQLSTAKTKGLFVGNDGGISALATLAPWSAGSEFIKDDTIVFNNERTAAAWAKVKELNDAGVLLIGSPTDWHDPSAFTQSLTAMQWTGLWAMPGIKKAIGDDFGVLPWPALDAQGRPATFWRGWAQMVNAKSKHVEEAKAFVKWLWIESAKNQQDWSLSYGFHVPPRKSIAASAEPLKSGPAAKAVEYLYDNGHILPPTWTNPMNEAINTALANIVKNGADPGAEVSAAAQKAQAELDKLLK